MNKKAIEALKSKVKKEQLNASATSCEKCITGKVIYNFQGIFSCTNPECKDFEPTQSCHYCLSEDIYLKTDDYFYCFACGKD